MLIKKTCFLILLCMTFSLHGAVERRAAYDLGSGTFKLLVADFDTDTQTIVKYLFSTSVRIPLIESLAKSEDQQFSPQISQKAHEHVHDLKVLADQWGAERHFGVATEAFRVAQNGVQLLASISERQGVTMRIIDQIEEAELGFLAAIAHAKSDPEEAVVWDIGNGSFQVSWKEAGQIHSLRKPIGKTAFKNLILEKVQGKREGSPNPISPAEAELGKSLLQERLGEVPVSLQKKLLKPTTVVYGIGAIHNSNISYSSKQMRYTQELVDVLLAKRLGLPDAAFDVDAPELWVSDLIFVSAVMSHLNISSVLNIKAFDDPHVATTGSTVGILVCSDYWPNI